MYVIAKYSEGSKHSVMDLFRQTVCSVDVTATGTVCHAEIGDDAFSAWYGGNDLASIPWTDVELVLVCDAAIVVSGKQAELDGITLFVAENESVISTTQAKACGLWTKILDSLYQFDLRH
ncbi:MAG: hypothetical protein VXX11_03640 [Planctomycetota bacterium]|nr:hypothetical protein [Planctomycetota bacterium]